MGLFGSNKPKWQSYEVGDIGADIVDLMSEGKKDEAKKLFNDFKTQAKKGKIPGVTAKEQKEMDKIYKRASQGERGIKAALVAAKELSKASGRNGYANRPLSERVHPAKFRQEVARGKYTPTAQEAANIKKNDPALYKQLLDQEARKRGWL